MQADPMVQAPENIQSLNRYSYVMNNPLNATDPSGYVWVTLVVMALKAIAASAAVSSAVATAIGYVLTAYKFYGYYQMARGVLAASKGNSAMIGKFVGGMVKNYAKSMAISIGMQALSSLATARSSDEQGNGDSDLIEDPEEIARSDDRKPFDKSKTAALKAEVKRVNEKITELPGWTRKEGGHRAAAEWLHKNGHPLSEEYDAEVGAKIFFEDGKYKIGTLVTDLDSSSVTLGNSLGGGTPVASWHSHGKAYVGLIKEYTFDEFSSADRTLAGTTEYLADYMSATSMTFNSSSYEYEHMTPVLYTL